MSTSFAPALGSATGCGVADAGVAGSVVVAAVGVEEVLCVRFTVAAANDDADVAGANVVAGAIAMVVVAVVVVVVAVGVVVVVVEVVVRIFVAVVHMGCARISVGRSAGLSLPVHGQSFSGETSAHCSPIRTRVSSPPHTLPSVLFHSLHSYVYDGEGYGHPTNPPVIVTSCQSPAVNTTHETMPVPGPVGTELSNVGTELQE